MNEKKKELQKMEDELTKLKEEEQKYERIRMELMAKKIII
jgi:hypothetical protein